MKIGIFTNNYLPNPYGVTSSIESFRKEFEALGHEVFIFAPHWKDYQDTNPNVFRYPSIDIEFKFRFPLPIPYSRKMDEILAGLDLDIIHAQHPNLLGSAAAKWAKKKKIPLVFTWHALYDKYAHFAVIVPERLAAWWAVRNARIYANNCDQVVVPTKSVEKIIRDWGVVNENIEVIPSGVQRDFDDPDRELIRGKYAIGKEESVLVLVARLTEEKNVEFLFASVLPILQRNGKAKFLVVGEGYLVAKLKDMAIEAGVAPQVIFCGMVAKKEIKNYFAAGDIFVYASKSETQGMIINEAMLMGLPIVAVKATGIEDSVVDGQTGFLVAEDGDEFAVAVQKLIDGESLRHSFGVAAQKIAQEKYTAKICAEKMLQIYEEAIKSKGK